jgi:hypothetical protein
MKRTCSCGRPKEDWRVSCPACVSARGGNSEILILNPSPTLAYHIVTGLGPPFVTLLGFYLVIRTCGWVLPLLLGDVGTAVAMAIRYVGGTIMVFALIILVAVAIRGDNSDGSFGVTSARVQVTHLGEAKDGVIPDIKRRYISLTDVSSVKVKQNTIERWLNYGRVVFTIASAPTPDLVFYGIKYPERFSADAYAVVRQFAAHAPRLNNDEPPWLLGGDERQSVRGKTVTITAFLIVIVTGLVAWGIFEGEFRPWILHPGEEIRIVRGASFIVNPPPGERFEWTDEDTAAVRAELLVASERGVETAKALRASVTVTQASKGGSRSPYFIGVSYVVTVEAFAGAHPGVYELIVRLAHPKFRLAPAKPYEQKHRLRFAIRE